MNNNDIDKQDFQELIGKYLDGKTTLEEVKLLVNYYESFQKDHDWVEELGSEEIIKNRVLINILEVLQEDEVKKPKVITFNYRSLLKYAAIFIMAFGLGYMFVETFGSKDVPLLVIPDEAITLQLEDGKTIVLDNTAEKNITNAKGELVGVQKQDKLYVNDDAIAEELVYNEIKIPLGKRFELVLSDGTNVHLNAGSTLRFPNKFLASHDRKVFLNGEAYFDVAHNEQHPFIVNAEALDIRVLGTEFNVSSYFEDEFTNTVLVEGSVAVYESSQEYVQGEVRTLEPGYGALWDRSRETLSVESVDTDFYTSWRTGKLRFKNRPFKNLRVKLERQYNVTIINNNEQLENQIFNMHFDIEDINEVLKTLNESYAIDYTIEDNKIIIN